MILTGSALGHLRHTLLAAGCLCMTVCPAVPPLAGPQVHSRVDTVAQFTHETTLPAPRCQRLPPSPSPQGQVFYRPEDEAKRREADVKKAGITHPDGDLMTLLRVYQVKGSVDGDLPPSPLAPVFVDMEARATVAGVVLA
jgi:hypothetical protein